MFYWRPVFAAILLLEARFNSSPLDLPQSSGTDTPQSSAVVSALSYPHLLPSSLIVSAHSFAICSLIEARLE
jgi:hypothetical protein